MLSSLRGWSGFQKCYAESGGVALRQNPTTILNRLANNSTCPGLTSLKIVSDHRKNKRKAGGPSGGCDQQPDPLRPRP
jgi:hypothetical protein